MSTLQWLEEVERAEVAGLGPSPAGTNKAAVFVNLSREELRSLGVTPPTRHRTYIVRSVWRHTTHGLQRSPERFLAAQPLRGLPIPLGPLPELVGNQ